MTKYITLDGNEAAARIAHLLNDVIAIYPITPSSPMGEFADEWSAVNQPNLWGTVPEVIEMQSEGGAAGAVHGALQSGALATTFTSSQGLLLMIPNMYKIAGELTPAVIHVAARALSAQALSIFGDHSDVMSVRATGFALLCGNSVQEAQDFACISQLASLKGRIPIINFFDGFRTSHEVSKIIELEADTIRGLVDEEAVFAQRQRAMKPENPVVRGTSQNPDVYFQGRETVNPFYQAFPSIVQEVMDEFGAATGRHYRLFEYYGAEDAEKVIVIMGSGCETVQETVDHMLAHGESVGMLKVRLFRPLDPEALLAAIPKTAKSIAVLDRNKEPGADGEPMYKDIVTAVFQSPQHFNQLPRIVSGRYGLSSKEFTPTMVQSIYEELGKETPKNHFSVGIIDDLTHSNLDWDAAFRTDALNNCFQALFYGLGSDGTVSANKNSIKIIGETTDMHAQGYFVYDSKKSGAMTISHLRFGPDPIHSTYLIADNDADFIACHQDLFLEQFSILDNAKTDSTFLLNTSTTVDKIWDTFPTKMQQQIIDKNIKVYIIDAYAVAKSANMGNRINTIMQTCFFAISGVLPKDQAINAIKDSVEKTYGKKSRSIVELNIKAIDATLDHLVELPQHSTVTTDWEAGFTISDDAPEFVKTVTSELLAGKGDLIPVSLLPNDGTYPTGTTRFEKRNLADEIPVWETDLCTHCGKCVLVCPHAAIRSKAFPASAAENAPASFKHVQIKGKEFIEGTHIAYQTAPEDCTGCTLCVDICPIRDKSDTSRKALNMKPQPSIKEQERENWDFFLTLPDYDRGEIKRNTIKGAMLMEPLFEFSGACIGCGETPYVKLASQLFGDRMVVANATGCSSIYGGNLPTTPWSQTAEGRGPAWNNSLFEDNAEFGLGMRIAIDKQRENASELLEKLKGVVPAELVEATLSFAEANEAEIHEQRERVSQITQLLNGRTDSESQQLVNLADSLCRRSVWIMGGDGWAYDIGFGGLDHVLASGKDVNILVMDTEVYSNTGGQTSKATPLGAVAKFSAAGKRSAKKDLPRLAMDYENVYVAHVAYGAKDTQTLNTFLEAESYPGPSLIIAYSPCIAHGFDMKNNHQQQVMAVDSGHWPLFRFDPRRADSGKNPLRMDSKAPSVPYREFMQSQTRFNMLSRSHPEDAEMLAKQAEQQISEHYHRYQQLAAMEWKNAEPEAEKK